MSNDLNIEIGNSLQPAMVFHPALRLIARFFSIVFHPLFIVSYTMAFLIFIHPAVFTGMEYRTKILRIIHIILLTAFMPLFAIFIMSRLKLFLYSINVSTAKERIIPYLIAMIFYWWPWNVFRNLPDSPPVATKFLLGSFLAICAAFFCNIFFKISIHATAVGGLLMFFLLFSFSDNYASGLYLSLAILVAGIVCTARYLASDHSSFEIYSGLLAGMLTQFIAWQFSS